MNEFHGIKAISFDAAGTLIRLRRPVGQVYAEIAARHGFPMEPAFAESSFRKIWKAMPPRADGPRDEDDAGFWRTLVRQVLSHAEHRPEVRAFEALFQELYEQYRGAAEWEAYPEARQVLRQLFSRFSLAVTSNYDQRLPDTLKELGLADFFQFINVSSTAGADKPSPLIFQITATKFGVGAGEILHVGDEPEADYHGATRAGMQAWLVQRPEMDLQALFPLLPE